MVIPKFFLTISSLTLISACCKDNVKNNCKMCVCIEDNYDNVKNDDDNVADDDDDDYDDEDDVEAFQEL
jgi:hypothetical protein